MRAVIQRVTEASVTVDGERIAEIGAGFLALVCAEEGDAELDARYIADKIHGLRIFEDEAGKMNRSLGDANGSVLLVSQFTLAGDARHGRRPSFSSAARPDVAVPLLDWIGAELEARGVPVRTGKFQADMQVALVNDGPVTILLDSRRRF